MRISDITGAQHEIRTFIPSDKFPSTRCIGIEVEVENAMPLHGQRFNYWSVIADSSLRNEGAELLLRQPLCGSDLAAALIELEGIFSTHTNVHVSERCSVHVHVDVRDMDHAVVGKLLAAYIGCESALYMLGGKNRYDNIYCPGVSSALEQTELMRRAIRGDADTFTRACADWCKYTGINLKSVMQRGSVEFRAHEGTLDVSRIEQWVRVLLRLALYAENVADPDVIFHHVQEGWREFAQRVFGPDADLVINDGVYSEFYSNNLTNLIDVLDDGTEYRPERNENAVSNESGDTDLDSVIAQINSLLEQA